MNYSAYIKGSTRGEFQWECVNDDECDYVYMEETSLDKNVAEIIKNSDTEYNANINFAQEPWYDEKEFTSRRAARNWCEREIRKSIANKKSILLT